MASAPASFVWTGDSLVERDLAAHRALLAADSWFVTPAGSVRALDAHRTRFLAAASRQGARGGRSDTGTPSESEVAAFWSASMGRLRSFKADGEDAPGGDAGLFPRVELAETDDGRRELRLRVRVAPRRRSSAVLVTHDGPDPRREPRVKGPDLEHLIALRAAAQENGADELVLLDHGLVTDGASSALLWWRGDVLAAPAGDLARVDSVTARSIRLIATATGTRVVEERARPGDLEGCELWIVSALHGISVVDHWIGGPALDPRPRRAVTWNRRLEALRRPL
ncbi:aminotransferase class IV [Herbiconiux moechotypicola]|uniref:Aminotransferase class IV n=1 Tax=Herbiconiux moechotypicola TaxID=637393 RepID=A0ABP5QHK8_9MICO|nr:aminotransferase class IV [Herbiconiux moechotypicola]MCS5729856.1 aminotransferase class IV [Herbiconiux moechotypicola]